MLPDIYKDSEHGQSRGVAQSRGQIGVEGFHVDDVHLETSGNTRKRPEVRQVGPGTTPRPRLPYLHRVSAPVHGVFRAVGGRAAPVEVQLDGVVHIWKAAATHRHAGPDLHDDWNPKKPYF